MLEIIDLIKQFDYNSTYESIRNRWNRLYRKSSY